MPSYAKTTSNKWTCCGSLQKGMTHRSAPTKRACERACARARVCVCVCVCVRGCAQLCTHRIRMFVCRGWEGRGIVAALQREMMPRCVYVYACVCVCVCVCDPRVWVAHRCAVCVCMCVYCV